MSVNESPMSMSPVPRVRRVGGRAFQSVDFVPSADAIAGFVVAFGPKIGVTNSDVEAEQPALAGLDVTGMFDFPKVDAAAFAWGDAVMWDAAQVAADGEAGAIVAASGTTHGIVCQVGGAAAGSGTVRILLI